MGRSHIVALVAILSFWRFLQITEQVVPRSTDTEWKELQTQLPIIDVGKKKDTNDIHPWWSVIPKEHIHQTTQHEYRTTETKIVSNHLIRSSTTTLPYFVLHIGPPKTATTSIQCGLHLLSQHLAVKDNYYFLGRSCARMPRKMPNGLKSFKPYDFIRSMGFSTVNESSLQEIRDWFLRHQQQGHNLILSTEHIVSKDMYQISNPLIWKRLLQGLFKIRIVVAYRHYFEWSPSMYYQTHMHPKYSVKWPKGDDGWIPPLLDYLQDHLDYAETLPVHTQQNRSESVNRRTDSPSMHLSLGMYRLWSLHFDDVYLLDLHKPNDVLMNFVCYAIPSAKETCQRLQKQFQESGRNDNENGVAFVVARQSSNLFAERTVDAALRQNLILPVKTATHTRRQYVKKVRRELASIQFNGQNGENATTRSPYMDCASPTLTDRIRNTSLSFLRDIHSTIPATAIAGQIIHHTNWTAAVQEHDILLEHAKKKGKYCDINTTMVLHNSAFVRKVFGVDNVV